MGIIQNQAAKSNIYIYLGVAVGFLNSILFPRYLSTLDKGTIDAITSSALLLAAIFSLGIPMATLRLFPNFRNPEKKHHGYFSFLLIASVVGFIIGLMATFFVFKIKVPAQNQTTFYFIVLAVAFLFRLLFNNLDVYNRMLYNSTLGIMSSNLLLKLTSLISIILFAFSIIDVNGVLMMHALALSVPGILSIFYTIFFHEKSYNFKEFKQKFNELNIKKDFIYTSVYGLMASAGSVVILEIDKLMLLDFMSLDDVGIYATAAFFGIMVNVPSRALKSIAAVIIADSFKKNDMENIKTVYQKSTLNLQIVSGFLFIGILICAPYVYSFMKPEYATGISIIIYIAIAQFIDAITSVNSDILATSKYYKYQTIFMFLMIFLVILLNYLLIPKYGMTGAAISTMISISLTNIFRTVFIHVKLNMQPFSRKNVYLLLLSVGVYIASFFVNNWLVASDVMHLLIMGTFITLLYWILILSLNFSADINSALRKMLTKFRA
ncbi:MAG: polysaccharide biosynthesis C-terminal domain-containing protein [Bacteroidia bacterium]